MDDPVIYIKFMKISICSGHREEPPLINGIIFKGERIIVPEKIQKEFLAKLHQTHLGIENISIRARTCVFWPSINQQITEIVKRWDVCTLNQNQKSKEPIMSTDASVHFFQLLDPQIYCIGIIKTPFL